MKTKKYTFNQLLFKYNKYRAKLDRFRLTNRNTHRQGVLEKHIERLREKLYSLYASIKTVGKVATLATALAIAIPNTADAQIQFAPVVVNPFGLIHLGASSNSELVDLDGDGDLDMMSGEYSGFFYYFENAAGAGNTPVFFAGAQTNPFSLTNIGLLSNSELVDLDGDGDLDMMAGESSGNFNYFENTAGAGNTPVFAVVQTNPFGLTDIGASSNSDLVDLDGDGDLDMMSGANNGVFNYFENTAGAGNTPVFAAVQINPFSLTDIGLVMEVILV
ncbi:MAG: FG-GAP-like repeat-containing protein [Chitinophagales bacterium]